MQVTTLDGRTSVFTFNDKTIDETYGELVCTILRQDPTCIERASHITDYDGFRIEVVTATSSVGGSAVQQLKHACDLRAAQVSTMLASLSSPPQSSSSTTASLPSVSSTDI